VPGNTILDIPAAEQEQMLSQLRRARYEHLLALHILLLSAAGWTPKAISCALFCSRSSIYRLVCDYRKGNLDLGLGYEAASGDAIARVSSARCWLWSNVHLQLSFTDL
jgi:hypothetical protein